MAADAVCGNVMFTINYYTQFSAMPPITSLFTESSDPLDLCLLAEHRKRYERIKAWREAQSDPYFTEVTPLWRDQFGNEEEN